MHITKMHGCGSDYCLVKYDKRIDYSLAAKSILNRRVGVGADALLVVNHDTLELFGYNPDGTRMLSSGNGIRCYAKYAYDLGLIRKNKVTVATGSEKVAIEILGNDPFSCRIEMGKPLFNNSSIYVSDCLDSFGRVIKIDDSNVTVYSFYMKGIQTVVFVNDFNASVIKAANKIANDRIFNRKTDVTFVKVLDRTNIKILTYNIASGFLTGSEAGACAAVIAASKLDFTDKICNVIFELGTLEVEVKKNQEVLLTGSAVKLFEVDFDKI